MRTTVTLEPDLERALREISLKTRKPFKKVLNDHLRAGIALSGHTKDDPPFRLQGARMNLLTGIDPAGFNKLGDDLEADAFLESTRKLIKHSK